MPLDRYMTGSIYHMVHFKNIESIFFWRSLCSLEKLRMNKVIPHSIANKHIQDLRDRIFVQYDRERIRSLHSYVPFYFASCTSMLHAQEIEIQKQIVILEVGRFILNNRGVLFTDGNATNQQLSKHQKETVLVTPAIFGYGICKREYRPKGPLGTNSDRSNFYADPMFLKHLNWDVISSRKAMTKENKRRRQAEVLVPNQLSLKLVKGIFTSTVEMSQAVNILVAKYSLTGTLPLAVCRPKMFQ